MGDEFFANLGKSRHPSIEKIAESLSETSRYVIERNAVNEAALRFENKQRRPSWPEDFQLTMHENGLLLTIHISTKSEREQLIRDAETSLRHLGIKAAFEEI